MAESVGFDDSAALNRQQVKAAIASKFVSSPAYQTNFYRQLSNDGCFGRHDILEPQTLEKFCPLDNGRHVEPAMASLSTGLFSILPLELRVAILVEELDLATLTHLRSVSRGMRDLVSSLPQYNAIVTYASASLRASLSLEIASWTSCRVLYETLCSPSCSCGAFGAYLYLPTYQRVCYHCFTTSIPYAPLTPSLARARFALTSRNLVNVPTIRSLPGNYRLPTGFGDWDRKRIRLMDMSAVGEVALTVHGSPEAVSANHRQAHNDRIRAWAERTLEWQETPEDDRPEHEQRRPLHTLDIDTGDFNSHRRMFIVGFPWLDRRTDSIEWGVACNGCRFKSRLVPTQKLPGENKKKGPRPDRVLYSKQEFMDHILNCEELFQLFIKEHDKIAGGVRENWRPYCRVAGDAESIQKGKEDGTHETDGCFLWHGKEAYGKVW